MQGTPKNFQEAVRRAVTADNPEEVIQDFLAQRFGAAMILAEINCNRDAADRIQALFLNIVENEQPGRKAA